MRSIVVFFIVFTLITEAGAQQLLRGKIYDIQTDAVLPSVTIFNASSNLYVLSTSDGEYAVVAQEGDKIVFTSVGYLPDTVKVLHYMIDAGYDISMTVKKNLLKNVDVRAANYKADSLKRREAYAAFYNRPQNEMLSKSGPQNGVGVAVSPIGFFSKRAKERKMNKVLEYQEEQDFVNYSFSRRYVEKLTGLRGDSLLHFMLRYRPTYLFCRNASAEDMLQYVNDKLLIYLKHEDATVKPKK